MPAANGRASPCLRTPRSPPRSSRGNCVGFGEHLADEATIAIEVPREVHRHAGKPDRQEQRRPVDRCDGRRGCGRRCGGVDERQIRSSRAASRWALPFPFRRGAAAAPSGARAAATAISRCPGRTPRDGLADKQYEQHRSVLAGDVGDDPAGHDLSAFSSASISAMSSGVSRSRSASWATSGVTRPPNSRSTSLRDSRAT